MVSEVVNVLFELQSSDLVAPCPVPGEETLRGRYGKTHSAVFSELPARRAFGDITNSNEQAYRHHRGVWTKGASPKASSIAYGSGKHGGCSLSTKPQEVSVLERLRSWTLRRQEVMQLALRIPSFGQVEQAHTLAPQPHAAPASASSAAAGTPPPPFTPRSPPEELFTPGSQPDDLGADLRTPSSTRPDRRLSMGQVEAADSAGGRLDADRWHTPPSSGKRLEGSVTPTSVLSSCASSKASMVQESSLPGIPEQPDWPIPMAPMYLVSHRKLGEGGCATVHRCRHQDETAHRYAAKCIAYGPVDCCDNLQPIFDEINIMRERAAGLPHVIELEDWAFDDESMEAYLIFRRLHGCTLEELKDQRWFHALGLPRREAVLREVARQLFQALSALHERGACHCDVKGSNVFLTLAAKPAPPGTLDVQLIDFGLAERCNAGQQVRMIGGTPAYMCPEVVKARTHALAGRKVKLVDPRAVDVFSAAVTLFEAGFGAVPFWVTASEELAQLQELRLVHDWALSKPQRWSCKALPLHDMHTQLRQLSPAAQDFFHRALCPDPEARLTVAQALQHDFLRAGNSHALAVPEAVLAGFARR